MCARYYYLTTRDFNTIITPANECFSDQLPISFIRSRNLLCPWGVGQGASCPGADKRKCVVQKEREESFLMHRHRTHPTAARCCHPRRPLTTSSSSLLISLHVAQRRRIIKTPPAWHASSLPEKRLQSPRQSTAHVLAVVRASRSQRLFPAIRNFCLARGASLLICRGCLRHRGAIAMILLKLQRFRWRTRDGYLACRGCAF